MAGPLSGEPHGQSDVQVHSTVGAASGVTPLGSVEVVVVVVVVDVDVDVGASGGTGSGSQLLNRTEIGGRLSHVSISAEFSDPTRLIV
jgi:hypothetical protein